MIMKSLWSSAFLIVSVLVVHSQGDKILHGTTYRIKSSLDGSFLTSSSYTFQPKVGILAGKVFGDTWRDNPDQIWDAIVLDINKRDKGKYIWLIPKRSCLNELTALFEDAHKNSKNVIEVIPTEDSKYLLKSIRDNNCLQSNGLDPANYKTCDVNNIAQQWKFETLYEDK